MISYRHSIAACRNRCRFQQSRYTIPAHGVAGCNKSRDTGCSVSRHQLHTKAEMRVPALFVAGDKCTGPSRLSSRGIAAHRVTGSRNGGRRFQHFSLPVVAHPIAGNGNENRSPVPTFLPPVVARHACRRRFQQWRSPVLAFFVAGCSSSFPDCCTPD